MSWTYFFWDFGRPSQWILLAALLTAVCWRRPLGPRLAKLTVVLVLVLGFLPTGWLPAVHWTHRWLGVLLLGLFVHLALVGRTTAARLAAALAILQVSLGIATVLLQLAPVVRAAHAAVGYSLWAVLVWASVEAGGWPAFVPSDARAGSRREVVHAA